MSAIMGQEHQLGVRHIGVLEGPIETRSRICRSGSSDDCGGFWDGY